MHIKDFQVECHEVAKSKGFWDTERNTGEMLMLIVSEAAEALEADRKSRRARPEKMSLYFDPLCNSDENVFKREFEEHIKGSFEEELADMMIRIGDLAQGLRINLEFYITNKMRYNATRERLHGKKY